MTPHGRIVHDMKYGDIMRNLFSALPIGLALILAPMTLTACGGDEDPVEEPGGNEPDDANDNSTNNDDGTDDDDSLFDDDTDISSGDDGSCAGKSENDTCTEDDGFGEFDGYCCGTSDGGMACWEDPC